MSFEWEALGSTFEKPKSKLCGGQDLHPIWVEGAPTKCCCKTQAV